MSVVASFITVQDNAGSPVKVAAWLDTVTGIYTPMYSPDSVPVVQPVSDNGGSLTVDGTVSISGTVATTGGGGGTQYTEDAASSGGETGNYVLGIRRDADTSPVSADNDLHGLVFDNAGNLKVNMKAGGSLSVTSARAVISPTVTVSSSATPYTIDDVFGGKMTFTSALRSGGPGTGVLEKFKLIDLSGQKPQLRCFVFDSNPTVGTFTNNSPVVFSTDDTKIIDWFDILSADWKGPHGTTAHYFASVEPYMPVIAAAAGTTLYMAMVLLNAPTMVTTGDIVSCRATFAQD